MHPVATIYKCWREFTSIAMKALQDLSWSPSTPTEAREIRQKYVPTDMPARFTSVMCSLSSAATEAFVMPRLHYCGCIAKTHLHRYWGCCQLQCLVPAFHRSVWSRNKRLPSVSSFVHSSACINCSTRKENWNLFLVTSRILMSTELHMYMPSSLNAPLVPIISCLVAAK